MADYSDSEDSSEYDSEAEQVEIAATHAKAVAFGAPKQQKKTTAPKSRAAPKKAVKPKAKPQAAVAVTAAAADEEDEGTSKKKRNPPVIKPWDMVRAQQLIQHLHLVADPTKLTPENIALHAEELQTLTADMFFVLGPQSSASRTFTYSHSLQTLAPLRQADAFPFSLLKPRDPCDEQEDPAALFVAIEKRAVKTQSPGLSDYIVQCVLHDPRIRCSYPLSKVADAKRLLGTVFVFKLRMPNEKNCENAIARVNKIRETVAEWFCRDLTAPVFDVAPQSGGGSKKRTAAPKKSAKPKAQEQQEEDEEEREVAAMATVCGDDEKKKNKKKEEKKKHSKRDKKKAKRSAEEALSQPKESDKKRQKTQPRELTTEEAVARCSVKKTREDYEKEKAWFYKTYGDA
jgi:hypothetical protein